MRDLIPGEAPDSYAVISGDTLWEIAEQIIGDPFWWPKLWLFNPQVKNPHWIVPGTVLHFYARGSGGGGTIDTDGNEAVDVPPPTTQPVLLAKPNSPHMGDPVKEDPWAKGKLILEDQEAGASQLVEVIGEMKGAEGELVLLPGFFVKGDVETLGNVMDVRSNALVPQKGALLYALLNDAPAGGQKLLLARKGMQPRTPTMETPSENFWTIVAECGVVNTKDDITTVMILNTFQSIELGDVFIPYQNLYFPFTPGLAKDSLPPAKSNAAIIGVGDGSRVSAGKGMVVFLSQPEEGPWNPGEILPIYMPPGGTVSFEEAHMPALQVGKVQVVHGTPEWALGVVTEAKREITVGAQTTPQFQSGPFSEE